LRIPVVRPPNVEIQLIEPDVFIAALPFNHYLARRKLIALDELTGQSFIGCTPSREGGLQVAVTQLLLKSCVMPCITQEAAQVQTVIGLVESGLGVALVSSVIASMQSRIIVFRPLHDTQQADAIGIGLGFNRTKESPVARRFREVVADIAVQRSIKRRNNTQWLS